MEANKLILSNAKQLLEIEEYLLFEDAITSSMMDLIENAGIIEAPRIGYYSKDGKTKKESWKINGFTINSEVQDYSLELFITDYSQSEIVETISKASMLFLKDELINFLNDCLDNKISNVQEHTIIFQLAKDIQNNKSQISKVNLFVLTNKKFTNIHKQISNEKLGNIDLVIHYWDINRFQALLDNNNQRNILDLNILDYQKKGIKYLENSSSEKYKCYLAVIEGELLANLYRDFDTKLLESNVRAFLQQTGKVNKGIKDTIADKPFMFLPYNNGLSATASRITTNENNEITQIEDFQIVNGGQTTASLYYARQKQQLDLSKVNVALKLTIISDNKLKQSEVPFISKFANTQNKVSDVDLSSNHPFLIEIEKLSKSIQFADPQDKSLLRYWFFERANGQYREALNKEEKSKYKELFKVKYPASCIIRKIDIAKWLNIFENKPHLVALGGQKSFTDFIQGTAQDINDSVDSRYFIELIGKGILFKTLDKWYGRYNSDPLGDTNIKSFTVTYTLSLINLYLGDTLDYYKIAIAQELDEDIRNQCRQLMRHTYDYFVKKANGGLISELAKKKSTWDEFNKIKPVISIENIFKKYIIKDGVNKTEFNIREYLIGLDSLLSKGSTYWDALNIFSQPEHSSHELTIAERNNITKGYNYIFKLKGELSNSQLQKLISLDQMINLKFDNNEILKLSSRQSKSFPCLIEMHNKLEHCSEMDIKKAVTKIKLSNSKAKDLYIKAFNSFNLKRYNYEEMTLNEIRYLAWAIEKYMK